MHWYRLTPIHGGKSDPLWDHSAPPETHWVIARDEGEARDLVWRATERAQSVTGNHEPIERRSPWLDPALTKCERMPLDRMPVKVEHGVVVTDKGTRVIRPAPLPPSTPSQRGTPWSAFRKKYQA